MKKKLKAYIVDDEFLAQENLKNLLGVFCPKIEVIETFDTIQPASEFINANPPDVLFIDMEMPTGTGFDLLNSIEKVDFPVIIVSAYKEFAFEAFKHKITHYVTKPIDPDELLVAMERIEEFYQTNSQEKYIPLKSETTTRMVSENDIIRFEGFGSYTKVDIVNGDKYVESKTMGYFEPKLSENFVRVHRSHLINKNHIKSYLKEENNMLLMSNDVKIPVSRSKLKLVKKLLSI